MATILIEAFKRCDGFSQLILLLLAAMSLYSWGIILDEWLGVRRANVAGRLFLRRFQSRQNPLELYGAGVPDGALGGPLWRVYVAGCHRMKGLMRDSLAEGRRRVGTKEILDVEDAMAMAISRESLQLETRLWTLGTISSVSPLMGLFGTVWGVMVCFHDMGQQGTTSLRAVAPGLTVALITTVVGLAVAIPALVGHNLLSSQMRISVSRWKAFAMDFLNSLEDASSLGGDEAPRA